MQVKGDLGSASEVSEEEADGNGVLTKRLNEVFSVVSKSVEIGRPKEQEIAYMGLVRRWSQLQSPACGIS